jgi:hypothetical protein
MVDEEIENRVQRLPSVDDCVAVKASLVNAGGSFAFFLDAIPRRGFSLHGA